MQRSFAQKANLTFVEIIAIVLSTVGVVIFLFWEIYQRVYLYGGVLIHKLLTACGCTQMAQLIAMHPLIFIAVITLGLVIMTYLFYTVYRLIKLIIQTRRFVSLYLKRAKDQHSTKLRDVVAGLNIDASKVIEIRDVRTVVFCFGLWRPKVCISSGLIKMLDKGELEAVLLHEYHHLISREPVKMFAIKYFQSIFFFLPGIKAGVNKYLTYSELAADERATNNFLDKLKLARALYKISEKEENLLLRTGLALSFFSSVIGVRVSKLSNNDYVPNFKLQVTRFYTGLGIAIVVLLGMMLFLTDSSKAFAMHDTGSCISNINGTQNNGLVCDDNTQQSAGLNEGNYSAALTNCKMK